MIDHFIKRRHRIIEFENKRQDIEKDLREAAERRRMEVWFRLDKRDIWTITLLGRRYKEKAQIKYNVVKGSWTIGKSPTVYHHGPDALKEWLKRKIRKVL